LKYHKLGEIELIPRNVRGTKGRPKKDEKVNVVYKAKVNLELDEAKKKLALERKGKFIIATNELDEVKLSSKDILKNYKNQQSVERGFRFLKDPLFLSSSIFLKKEKRIIALSMIMCLCLLVYMLSQRYLRECLANLLTLRARG